jgi:hypothetical protein
VARKKGFCGGGRALGRRKSFVPLAPFCQGSALRRRPISDPQAGWKPRGCFDLILADNCHLVRETMLPICGTSQTTLGCRLLARPAARHIAAERPQSASSRFLLRRLTKLGIFDEIPPNEVSCIKANVIGKSMIRGQSPSSHLYPSRRSKFFIRPIPFMVLASSMTSPLRRLAISISPALPESNCWSAFAV